MASPPPFPSPPYSPWPPDPTPPPTPPPSPPPRPARYLDERGVAEALYAVTLDSTSEFEHLLPEKPSTVDNQQHIPENDISISEIFECLRIDYEREIALEETMMSLCGALPVTATAADFVYPFPWMNEADTKSNTTTKPEKANEPPSTIPVQASPAHMGTEMNAEPAGVAAASDSASPTGVVIPALYESTLKLTWFINLYMSFRASLLANKHLRNHRELRLLWKEALDLVQRAGPSATQAQQIIDVVAAWREDRDSCISLRHHLCSGIDGAVSVEPPSPNPLEAFFREFQAEYPANTLCETEFVQCLVAHRTIELMESRCVVGGSGVAESLVALKGVLNARIEGVEAALLEARRSGGSDTSASTASSSSGASATTTTRVTSGTSSAKSAPSARSTKSGSGGAGGRFADALAKFNDTLAEQLKTVDAVLLEARKPLNGLKPIKPFKPRPPRPPRPSLGSFGSPGSWYRQVTRNGKWSEMK